MNEVLRENTAKVRIPNVDTTPLATADGTSDTTKVATWEEPRMKDVRMVTTQNLVGNFTETPLQISKINEKFSENVCSPPKYEQLNQTIVNYCFSHVTSCISHATKRVQQIPIVIAATLDGHPPLAYAAETNNTPAVSLLIDLGYNLEDVYFNVVGWTPLNRAVLNRNFEMVALLIDAGAALNTIDSNGYTPLIICCTLLDFYKNDEVVNIAKLLIDSGADLNVVGRVSGRTALDWCDRSHNYPQAKKVAKMLVNNGARRRTQSSHKCPSKAPPTDDILKTYRSLLGLASEFTDRDLQVRYHDIVLKVHPDKGGNVKDFQEIQEAYRELKDYLESQ